MPQPASRLPTAFLRRALVAAAACLSLGAFAATQPTAASAQPAKSGAAKGAKAKSGGKAAAARPADKPKAGPLADFGKATASPEVVHVANWAAYTRDHQKRSFVIIDKKQARLYVFDPKGKLKGQTPILLGKAVGDTVLPGVATKPVSRLKDEEKTTPAGRFMASRGKNTRGDDVLWIDYNSGVSMHRMRQASAQERRAERMGSAEADDNRISNGCVNVPHAFFNGVLHPTVVKLGAIIYVLPETKTPQQQFGSFDVPAAGKRVQVAEAAAAPTRVAAR